MLTRTPLSSQYLLNASVLVCCACADEATADPRKMVEQPVMNMAAGSSADQPADSSSDAAADPPVVATSICTPDDIAKTPTLAIIPAAPPMGPGITLLRHKRSTCNRGPAQVILHNTGSEAVHIEDIAMGDSRFSVERPALPYDLAAGDILALELSFQAWFREAASTLSVATQTGCAQFRVKGMNVGPEEGSVITPTPYVLNFGRVQAGMHTEPLEFSLLMEARQGAGARSSIGDISAISGSFRVEATNNDAAKADAAACTRISTRVSFVAPQKPGLVRSQLTWEAESEKGFAQGYSEVIALVE